MFGIDHWIDPSTPVEKLINSNRFRIEGASRLMDFDATFHHVSIDGVGTDVQFFHLVSPPLFHKLNLCPLTRELIRVYPYELGFEGGSDLGHHWMSEMVEYLRLFLSGNLYGREGWYPRFEASEDYPARWKPSTPRDEEWYRSL